MMKNIWGYENVQSKSLFTELSTNTSICHQGTTEGISILSQDLDGMS